MSSTTVVVDASVVVSWFLPDEKEGEHAHLFKKIQDLEIHVPQIFYFEVCNAFVQAVKRGRVDHKGLATIVDVLWKLPIHLDPLETLEVPPYFDSVVSTSAAHNLTVYDASYLELAIRLGGVPLITYDTSLIEAAKKLKLRLK